MNQTLIPEYYASIFVISSTKSKVSLHCFTFSFLSCLCIPVLMLCGCTRMGAISMTLMSTLIYLRQLYMD